MQQQSYKPLKKSEIFMKKIGETYTLEVGGLSIQVTKKEVKGMRLSIHAPYGDIRASVPSSFSKSKVLLIINSKLSWIQKNHAKFSNQNHKPSQIETGQKIYFLGKTYELNVCDAAFNEVLLTDKSLIIFTKPNKSPAYKEAILNAWYGNQLKTIIPKMIKEWETKTGLKVKNWAIKRMKTRWGSCNPTAGRIWLNLELAKKPLHCLEYVIVHEMVHLLEAKHNKRFFSYMDQFMPLWRDYKQELNGLSAYKPQDALL
jgi:predicted metal-dependent hydrolase